MTNHMNEVARLLGVEPDEEFEIEIGKDTVRAKITDKDIYILCGPFSYNSAAVLRSLLRGDYAVRNISSEPIHN